MRNAGTKLAVLGVAAATAWGAWALGSALFGDDAEAEGTRHLVNQVWIERVPDNHRDMIGHLVILDHPQGKFGVVGKSSNWRHYLEVFMWKLEGSRLSLFFPQEEVKTSVKVKTWDCSDEAPHPFELCLKVSRGDRSATYYSRRDWKVDPQDVEDSLEDLADELPALSATISDRLEDPALGEDALEVDELDWPETDRFF